MHMLIQMQMMMGGGAQKYREHIHFGETLDLAPALSPGSPAATYDLHGVLVHHGSSANSGHYYSYVRAANGRWYCMDDDAVSPVSWSLVQQQRAYMLFYSRRIAVTNVVSHVRDPVANGPPASSSKLEVATAFKPRNENMPAMEKSSSDKTVDVPTNVASVSHDTASATFASFESLPPVAALNPEPLTSSVALAFPPSHLPALGVDTCATVPVKVVTLSKTISFGHGFDESVLKVSAAQKGYRVLSESCSLPGYLQPFAWDSVKIRTDYATFCGLPPPDVPMVSKALMSKCTPVPRLLSHAENVITCLPLHPKRRAPSIDDGDDEIFMKGNTCAAYDSKIKMDCVTSSDARPPQTSSTFVPFNPSHSAKLPSVFRGDGSRKGSPFKSSPLERVEVSGGRRSTTLGATVLAMLQDEHVNLGTGIDQWGETDEHDPLHPPFIPPSAVGDFKRGRPAAWTTSGRRPDEEYGAALGQDGWNDLLDAGKLKKVKLHSEQSEGDVTTPTVSGADNAFQKELNARRDAQSLLPGGQGYRKGMGGEQRRPSDPYNRSRGDDRGRPRRGS